MAKVIKSEMDLMQLAKMDDEKCRVRLIETRWKDGIECPRCHSHQITNIPKRHQFKCADCQYQFSVTAGTSFQDSPISLLTWFIIIYLVLESKDGITTAQTARMTGVSYKAAWFILMRIRNAMKPAHTRKLSGIVEVDEFFVGGTIDGMGQHYVGNKDHVVGAVERGGEVRLKVIQHADGKTLKEFIEANVEPTARIITDEWRGYNGVERETVNHHLGEYVRGDVHTGTIDNFIGMVKNSVYQHTSHFQSYLDEICYKYNNRNDYYLFRNTLKLMLATPPKTWDELVHPLSEEVLPLAVDDRSQPCLVLQ
jgi:transposase-like protein